MKKCNKCGLEKELCFFVKKVSASDGYRNTCKICRNAKDRNNRIINGENIREYYRKYENINKEILNENRRNRYNERIKNEPLFKVKKCIKTLISNSIKYNGYKKNTKTEKILGISMSEFIKYIESLFEPWMNWENHGKYTGKYNETWQIDHIIPISEGMSEKDIISLNHFSNLRPLCSKLNLEKSNFIIIQC